MPVRQFMTLCLTHPDHGYYTTRDPIGVEGDFITSPEVSQVFGELIGLWAASAWHQMGQPENVRLVELGPGRGTMMLDALRAAQAVPAFRAAIVLHLVEVNPKLREKQQQALGTVDVPSMWHETFEEVPDGPAIILANEFFDALPINQAIKQFNGWYERVVEIDGNDKLVFGIASEVIPLFDQLVPAAVRDAPVGAIYEWRTDNLALGIGQRVVRQGGAALIVDYGHVKSSTGETLQAVGGHAFVDPLHVARRGGPHRACRLRGDRACRREHGRAHSWTGRSDAAAAQPWHRQARRGAEGICVTREGRRGRRGLQAAAGRDPHRHGQAVQGHRHQPSGFELHAGLRVIERGRSAMLQARSLSALPGIRHAFFTRAGGVSERPLRKPERRAGLGRFAGESRREPRADGGGDRRRRPKTSSASTRSIRRTSSSPMRRGLQRSGRAPTPS